MNITQKNNKFNLDDYNLKLPSDIEDKSINENEEDIIETEATDDNQEDELPMTWYNFWIYVRIPLGIINSIGLILPVISPDILYHSLGICIINLIMIVYQIFLFYSMKKRKRNTLSYIIIALVLETLNMTLNSPYIPNITMLAIMLVIFSTIWFLPNYIYFKKRENIFVN